MAHFMPRQSYPHLSSIPRSYYLGHHAAALTKMKTLLSQTDLVIECRDYRTPLVSRNPLFEDALAGQKRLIVYMKRDLGIGSGTPAADRVREQIVQGWDCPSSSLFLDVKDRRGVRRVLDFAREHGASANRLVGSRMLVVGMPNVGKSSLLNALRSVGIGGGVKKAARTGGQPGITRKLGTSVKILAVKKHEGEEEGEEAEAVYLLDTPGVFIPYVPDAESMLKLALCGNVKDNVIPPTTIADYLLYHLNLQDPTLYASISEQPTNDIHLVLDRLARKQGRLKRGGEPEMEAAALQFVHRWRAGEMGRFVLDEITEDALDRRKDVLKSFGRSITQAKKVLKQTRKLAGQAQAQAQAQAQVAG